MKTSLITVIIISIIRCP